MMDMDQGKYFSLNQTATAIWELLDKPLAMDELCDSLLEEYEVNREECFDDVRGYLEEMIKMGLVKEV